MRSCGWAVMTIGRTAIPRIALAGNPNCGKTTLFNELTGSRQYVGNWPGVTVSRKFGITKSGKSELVDLPGIYSLSPYSMEETVARDYLVDESPDAVINIIDGTNLERNLYLTLQLMELGIPVVAAVNMMDEVRGKGWTLDCGKLSESLHIPVIPIAARSGENTQKVLAEAERLAAGKEAYATDISYDNCTQNALSRLLHLLEGHREARPALFYAGKLLEGNSCAGKLKLGREEKEEVEKIVSGYESGFRYGDRETLLADARYRKIEEMAAACLKKPAGPAGMTVSEKIDRIAISRFFALPLFLLMLFAMFSLTFGPVGKLLSRCVESFFSDFLNPSVSNILSIAGAPGWCRGLLLDGVIGGVSGVLVFLPQIALLFCCLSLLEDSGYMARAAFLMDRILRRLGLSGKSFIPMLMGFGCTTPAVMAARALENEKDRRMTIMLTPFMSCGARLPIYAIFAGVFFPQKQGMVVFGLYLLGILVAVASGFFLKKTVFRGETAPFVLELPPYRMPQPVSVLRHVWEKVKGFLIKAGTLIFAMSVLLWLAKSFSPSFRPALDAASSILGVWGEAIAPLFTPLGFGTWQAAVALLSGLIAKESVVSSLTVLYAGGNAALLPAMLAASFTPASALAFMTFCLLYMPCISAFATIVKEMNSLKWALGTAILSTVAAYSASFLVYRVALLFF